MKLKSMMAAVLLAASLNVMAADITLSPVYTVVEVVRSAIGTVLSPFATTTELTVGTSAQLQALAVRNEAMDFIANGETSERLTASFKALRKVEGLESKSDAELAKLIVLSL